MSSSSSSTITNEVKTSSSSDNGKKRVRSESTIDAGNDDDDDDDKGDNYIFWKQLAEFRGNQLDTCHSMMTRIRVLFDAFREGKETSGVMKLYLNKKDPLKDAMMDGGYCIDCLDEVENCKCNNGSKEE